MFVKGQIFKSNSLGEREHFKANTFSVQFTGDSTNTINKQNRFGRNLGADIVSDEIIIMRLSQDLGLIASELCLLQKCPNSKHSSEAIRFMVLKLVINAYHHCVNTQICYFLFLVFVESP